MDALKAYETLLPAKPYWTHDPKRGTRIGRNLGAAFLQPNSPFVTHWIVIDVDHPGAARGLFAMDTHMPTPNIVVGNKATGHAHYFYRLATPVLKFRKSAKAPQAFLSDVTKALVASIPGADPHYHGPLARNPLNTALHDVSSPREAPYTLAELREWGVAREGPSVAETARTVPEGTPGRNCHLFQTLAAYAYKNVGRALSPGEFTKDLEDHAFRITKTKHGSPLGRAEVLGVVRSVAKWTWARRAAFVKKDPNRPKNPFFVEKGRRGGIASGASRRSARLPRILSAQKMVDRGESLRSVARKLGVTPSTVSRWKLVTKQKITDFPGKEVLREAIKDNSPKGGLGYVGGGICRGLVRSIEPQKGSKRYKATPNTPIAPKEPQDFQSIPLKIKGYVSSLQVFFKVENKPSRDQGGGLVTKPQRRMFLDTSPPEHGVESYRSVSFCKKRGIKHTFLTDR